MSAPFRIRQADVGVKSVAQGNGADLKNYLDRLMKMIPVEVISLYLVGSGIIPEGEEVVLFVWSLICLFAVIASRAYGTSDPAAMEDTQWAAVAISCVAFVIWLYTLGGPFEVIGWHKPYIGSLLVMAWTFFVPIFYKGT